MKQIPQWTVFEEVFESDRARGNPPAELGVTVTFTAPSGRERRLDAFWDGGRRWRLRPAPDLLAAQPGLDEPRAFTAAAATEEGDWAVVYSPMGGSVKLDVGKLQRPPAARWFDPRTAEWRPAGPVAGSETEYACPDDRDWVLDPRAEESRR